MEHMQKKQHVGDEERERVVMWGGGDGGCGMVVMEGRVRRAVVMGNMDH